MANPIELRQKRARLIEEGRQILNSADAEKRQLTADETEKYEKIMADVDAMKADIDREERQSGLEAELRGQISAPIQGVSGGVLDSQEYRGAFNSYLRKGVNGILPQDVRSLNSDEIRAMSVGVNSEGGYIVPQQFSTKMIKKRDALNNIRGLATVMKSYGELLIPVDNDEGEATFGAEKSAYAEASPEDTFDQKKIGAFKLKYTQKVTEELVKDAGFDLESFLAEKFARKFARGEEKAFIAGTGTGEPEGLTVGAGVGVTTASATAITSDELIDFDYSVTPEYRAVGSYLMHDSTAKVIRKLKNATTGDYMWQPGLVSGAPDKLFGRPVYTSPYMPAIGAEKRVIVFGDLSYYWIADRSPLFVQRLNELYIANGYIGFRGFSRLDAKVTSTDAIKALVMHA